MNKMEKYIETEVESVDILEEKLSILEKKWFKTSVVLNEILFLKKFIELKKNFIETANKLLK